MTSARSFNLIHIAHRLFDTPLAIHPAKFEIIVKSLGARFGIDPSAVLNQPYSPAFETELTPDTVAALRRSMSGGKLRQLAVLHHHG